MIFIDRIFSFLTNDVYRPLKCYANHHNKRFVKHEHCTCKNFCKYPPGNNPIYLTIKNK